MFEKSCPVLLIENALAYCCFVHANDSESLMLLSDGYRVTVFDRSVLTCVIKIRQNSSKFARFTYYEIINIKKERNSLEELML
jgi:hypothetical protein